MTSMTTIRFPAFPSTNQFVTLKCSQIIGHDLKWSKVQAEASQKKQAKILPEQCEETHHKLSQMLKDQFGGSHIGNIGNKHIFTSNKWNYYWKLYFVLYLIELPGRNIMNQ